MQQAVALSAESSGEERFWQVYQRNGTVRAKKQPASLSWLFDIVDRDSTGGLEHVAFFAVVADVQSALLGFLRDT